MSRAKPPAASAVTPGGKKEGAPGPKATRSGKRANAGVGSALDFSHDLGRIVVGQVLYQTGFDKLQFRTADLLAEIMFRYLELLATSTKGNAENAGRTEANLEDVNDVFYDLGVKMDDLREFCKLWLVEKSTKERGADKDGEPPDKSVPAGNDADDGERDGLGPKDAEGAGGSAAGAEQGEADASGAQSSRFVVAAPATVTGQFLRLPPGPFPVGKYFWMIACLLVLTVKQIPRFSRALSLQLRTASRRQAEKGNDCRRMRRIGCRRFPGETTAGMLLRRRCPPQSTRVPCRGRRTRIRA
ncbi:hypothetical protein DFJ74DRAFT_72905 [Hyaloraphidium curvatum]|nr:hypothetical protein DFJ74DRAFT_72905 [Hyaloraphidium curvatum]